MIEIYAGKTALQTIREQGFNSSLFSTIIGASGGPKWFTLYSWDKYLFSHFFNGRTTPITMMGSSAGAFRAACFGQADPIAAIERLAKHYSETVYLKKATAEQITTNAKGLLDVALGEHGASEILNNPVVKSHFFVAKSNGLTASDSKPLLGLGLLQSYLLNYKNRRLLSKQYERFVFGPKNSDLHFTDPDNIPTSFVDLTSANLKQALLASGSIPLVMQGVENISGCPNGIYRDGGIIDYHFDLQIKSQGLVLYPHFNASPRAGWFDKKLSRPVRATSYDNVVLICPSKRFVDALPYKKIPDRSDFTALEPAPRIAYWQTVFKETEKLAAEFHEFIETQNIEAIRPL